MQQCVPHMCTSHVAALRLQTQPMARLWQPPMLCADGGVVAWDGGTTALPHGFAALRLEALRLICTVTKRLAHIGSEPQRFCTGDAVHLLCRALRLAPTCYRQFSLAAHPLGGPRAQLKVMGIFLKTAGDNPGSDTDIHLPEEFGRFAVLELELELAATMRYFAAVEGLSVHLSRDASCVLVRRAASWHC